MKNYTVALTDPLIKILKISLINLPTPSSISYWWNIGFLLGLCLCLQIITGLILSISYIPHVDYAFESVIHIIRDLDSGWVMRYLHINGASLFFVLLFSHIARGIFFGSPNNINSVWTSGVLIFLMTIAAGFMGYVLPWGQISFWGATVITSMITAIPYMGIAVTQWVWGNFSVSQPTLNRFFSLHFLIPFITAALALCHLIFLHQGGSSNPISLTPDIDKINFFPFSAVKDVAPLVLISFLIIILVIISPNILGDVENFNTASVVTTPPHIQPEWYFLFAYAILRSIPSNLGGVVAMLASILVLLVLTVSGGRVSKKFLPASKVTFWVLVSTFYLLTWIGANPVEPPFIILGQALTLLYFSLFAIA